MLFLNFKQWFNESFENPMKIKWVKANHQDWEGYFSILDQTTPRPQMKQYVIKMMRGGGMPWEIKFELILDDETRSQEITGTGNAMLVFSTVLNGINQWMEKENPTTFMMSAREPSRQSLYKRLLGLLPRQNWKIEDLGQTFIVKRRKVLAA